MARPTYPRSFSRHAAAAADILARHERAVGAPVTLPVPIELIIEQTYRLQILWGPCAETWVGGGEILGIGVRPRWNR